MKTIHQKMKELGEQKLGNRLKETENSKNDSSRMFQVIKEIQRHKRKIPLLIKTETGRFTINEKEQAEIIAAHFNKQFSKNTQVLSKIHSQPTPINQPFTTEEIKKAIRSLRNNRSAGDDQIKVEMLKYSPPIFFTNLADICNNISETGRGASHKIYTRYNNANTGAWKAERTRSERSSYYASIDDKQSPCHMHEEMNC